MLKIMKAERNLSERFLMQNVTTTFNIQLQLLLGLLCIDNPRILSLIMCLQLIETLVGIMVQS